MIEKERLEELIKQRATVYELDVNSNIYPLDLRDYQDVKIEEVEEYSLNRLYETKEDAEWHKEFGCIERTERLELPTWEEFYDRDKNKMFKVNSFDYYLFKFGTQIAIRRYYQGKMIGIIFIKPLTEENYILACRKAKELFLGK